MLNQWATRNLTLIGRNYSVKTLAIFKLVYNTSVLTVPPNFAENLKLIIFVSNHLALQARQGKTSNNMKLTAVNGALSYQSSVTAQ